MHVAIALLKAGQRVATVDLDSRQQSFTHYIANRRAWSKHAGLDLEMPSHYCIARKDGAIVSDNEACEFKEFAAVIDTVEHTHDFIVIDTPGHDSYLMRLAHAMADTLITPLNDSFVDFDVLGTVDPVTFAVSGSSHFADTVRDARRQRRAVDHGTIDWIVVRNRVSLLGSRNKRLVWEGLQELSLRLGFRAVDGFAERVIFREFYPRGLTALDNLDEDTLGTRPSLSHVTARQEVESLLRSLRLPIDERGVRRIAARQEWFAAQAHPLELPDIIAPEPVTS
jgi:chromosome partitioning protein